METRSASFLVEPQNQGRRFVSGLASKSLGRFLIVFGLKTDDDGLSVVWHQNHWDGLSVVWPQNHWDGFLWFGLKTDGNSFWRFGLKTCSTVSGGLASKSAAMVSGGLASKSVVTVSAGLTSKPAATVSAVLASKPAATVSGGLTSKPVVTVSRFGHQNRQLRFGDLGIKIITNVSWFVPQKPRGLQFVGCTIKPTEGCQRGTRVEI
jgi:hypothetical protein